MIAADRAVVDLAAAYLRHHGRVDGGLGRPRCEMAIHLAALLDHFSRHLDRLTDDDRAAVVGCCHRVTDAADRGQREHRST